MSQAFVETVRFRSGDTELVGRLHRPATPPSQATPAPAVVVTGSWLTVKEQMASTYCAQLAARGLTALCFDFRNFGESGGEPRQHESPARKAADIHAAAHWLAQQAGVDGSLIGGLSICASAGYMAQAVVGGAPLATLVMVAPWLHDAQAVRTIYGGEPGVQARLAAAQAALDGSGPTHAPAASLTDPSAAMHGPFDYYLDATRGAVSAWTNQFALRSWADWLGFDPTPSAERITIPVALVHSQQAALPESAQRFHDNLRGPKSITWLEGASQFDFYDNPAVVREAVAIAARHFLRREPSHA